MSEASPASPIARGQALVAEGRLEDALAVFEAALATKPDNPEAAFYVGDTLWRLGRHDDALHLVSRAVAGEPTNAALHIHRGDMLLHRERYEEALADYDAALRLRPGAVDAIANRALTLTRLHRFDEALRGYAEAFAIAPESAELQWNDAILRLQLGDFENAWENFEARWKLAHAQPSLRQFPEPLWTGAEDISGKRILLYAEQGFGDTFQFIRYAPLVAALGATVFIEVQPAVVGLVRNSIPAQAVIAGGDPLPAVDFQCPLLSLPRAFRTRVDTIPTPTPYLHPRPDKVVHWSQELPSSSALRVGLVWTGASHHALDKKRSVPLGKLLAAIPPGMERVILQREMSDDDARLIGAAIYNPMAAVADFEDTAAIIELLDVVVTIDTSVAHLAGAMDKPVFLLLSHLPDWRWLLERSDSPWYPGMRLFRQPSPGDWDGALAQLTIALQLLMAEQ